MKILNFLFLLNFISSCSTVANIKLLPSPKVNEVKTMYKNKIVSTSPEFKLEFSDFIFTERKLYFIKDETVLGYREMEVTISIPIVLLGWIPFGIPYLWVTEVKKEQTINLTSELQGLEKK